MSRETEQLQSSGDDLNQFLEAVAKKVSKTLTEISKNNSQIDPQKLRIQKGRRVTYGQTARGFRQELTQEDQKTLNELLSRPPTEGAKAVDYERKVPNYEIKVGDEVLFRQERDGTITANQLSREVQQEVQQPTATERDQPAPEDFTYKDLFSEEWDPEPELESEPEEQTTAHSSETTQVQGIEAQPVTQDQDQDGLTDGQEQVFSTDPYNRDTDRDGVTDYEEVSTRTNPLAQDTDGDGQTDNTDPNPTERQSKEQSQVTSSTSEQNIENDVSPAVRVHQREAEKLPEASAKQLFQALGKKVGQKAKELGQQGVKWVANLPKQQREQNTAKVALELFNQNYEKTGQTRYEAVNYNVQLKGLNNYEVSDKEGNSLLKFQKGRLGIKVQENNLSAIQQKQFERAGRSLQQFEGVMEGDPQQRLVRLQNLAPQSDRDIVRTLKAKEVEQTANKFLTFMGTEKLNGGGMYSLERKGQDLKIISKTDKRGVVFERKGGQINNNLGSKDFTHFRDLNKALENSIQKVAGIQATQRPKVAQVKPKINKQQELSL